MNSKLMYLVAAIILIGGGVYWLLPSDKEKIRGNLDSLAEYCSTEKGEAAMETLQKAAQVTKLFTDPALVAIPSRDIEKPFTRKDISDNFMMLKKRLVGTHCSFQDTIVTFPVDDRAEVTTTLLLEGASVDGPFTDAYEVVLEAVKREGEWRFSQIVVNEFMQR